MQKLLVEELNEEWYFPDEASPEQIEQFARGKVEEIRQERVQRQLESLAQEPPRLGPFDVLSTPTATTWPPLPPEIAVGHPFETPEETESRTQTIEQIVASKPEKIDLGAFALEPLLPLGRLDAKNPKDRALMSLVLRRPLNDVEAAVYAGLYNVATENLEFFTSPFGMALIPITGAVGPLLAGLGRVGPFIARRGIPAAFAAMMLPHAVEKVEEAYKGGGDVQEWTEALGTSLIASVPTLEAIRPGTLARLFRPGRSSQPVEPKPVTEPERAQATARETREVLPESSAALEQQATDKTAPVVEKTLEERLAERAKQDRELAKLLKKGEPVQSSKPVREFVGKLAEYENYRGVLELDEAGRPVLAVVDIATRRDGTPGLRVRYVELPFSADMPLNETTLKAYKRVARVKGARAPKLEPAPPQTPIAALKAEPEKTAPDELKQMLEDLSGAIDQVREDLLKRGFKPESPIVARIQAILRVANMAKPSVAEYNGAMEAMPVAKRTVMGIIERLEREHRFDEAERWYRTLQRLEDFEFAYLDWVTAPGKPSAKRVVAPAPTKPAAETAKAAPEAPAQEARPAAVTEPTRPISPREEAKPAAVAEQPQPAAETKPGREAAPAATAPQEPGYIMGYKWTLDNVKAARNRPGFQHFLTHIERGTGIKLRPVAGVPPSAQRVYEAGLEYIRRVGSEPPATSERLYGPGELVPTEPAPAAAPETTARPVTPAGTAPAEGPTSIELIEKARALYNYWHARVGSYRETGAGMGAGGKTGQAIGGTWKEINERRAQKNASYASQLLDAAQNNRLSVEGLQTLQRMFNNLPKEVRAKVNATIRQKIEAPQQPRLKPKPTGPKEPGAEQKGPREPEPGKAAEAEAAVESAPDWLGVEVRRAKAEAVANATGEKAAMPDLVSQPTYEDTLKPQKRPLPGVGDIESKEGIEWPSRVTRKMREASYSKNPEIRRIEKEAAKEFTDLVIEYGRELGFHHPEYKPGGRAAGTQYNKYLDRAFKYVFEELFLEGDPTMPGDRARNLKKFKEEIGKFAEWVRCARQYEPGSESFPIRQPGLKVGDTLIIGGEKVKVIEINERERRMILDGGERFGKRRESTTGYLWIDDVPENRQKFGHISAETSLLEGAKSANERAAEDLQRRIEFEKQLRQKGQTISLDQPTREPRWEDDDYYNLGIAVLPTIKPGWIRALGQVARRFFKDLLAPSIERDRVPLPPVDINAPFPRPPSTEQISQSMVGVLGFGKYVPDSIRGLWTGARLRDPVDVRILAWVKEVFMGKSFAALKGAELRLLAEKLGNPFVKDSFGRIINVRRIDPNASLHKSDMFEAWEAQELLPALWRQRGVPENVIQAYERKNPRQYDFTDAQRAYMWAEYEILRQGKAYLVENNAYELSAKYRKHPAYGDPDFVFYPRQVVSKLGMPREISAKRAQVGGASYNPVLERLYKTEERGAKTTQYEPDDTRRIVLWMQRAYKVVADRKLVNDPVLQIVKPSELKNILIKEHAKELASGEMTMEDINIMARRGRLATPTREGWAPLKTIQPGFAGKLAPTTIAKRLNKVFGEEYHTWLKFMHEANKLSKTLVLTGDLAFLFQQGLAVLSAMPHKWGRTALHAIRSFSDPHVLARLLEDPLTKKAAYTFVENGGSLNNFYDFIEGGAPGELATRMPGVGPLFQRLARMMAVFLDVAKLMVWRAKMQTTPPEFWPEMVKEIERTHVLSARMESEGMRPGRALGERILALATSYYRAAIESLGSALAGGARLVTGQAKQYPAQVEAFRVWATLMGGWTALMTAAYIAAGMPLREIRRRVNPANKDVWLCFPVDVGDRIIEVGPRSIQFGVISLAAEVIEAATTEPERLASYGRDNPFIQWTAQKLGPFPKFVAEVYTGTDVLGRPTTPAYSAAEKIVPLAASQTARSFETEKSPYAVAEGLGNIFGIKVTVRTPRSELLSIVDEIMKDMDPRLQEKWREMRSNRLKLEAPYQMLRALLYKGELKDAMKEYQRLLETRGRTEYDAEKLIEKAMEPGRGTILGLSQTEEREVMARFGKLERKLYVRAEKERDKVWRNFLKMRDMWRAEQLKKHNK